jgi:hypothetical protein
MLWRSDAVSDNDFEGKPLPMSGSSAEPASSFGRWSARQRRYRMADRCCSYSVRRSATARQTRAMPKVVGGMSMKARRFAVLMVFAAALLVGCGDGSADSGSADREDVSAAQADALPLVFPLDVAIHRFPFEATKGGSPPFASLFGIGGRVQTITIEETAGSQAASWGYELDQAGNIRSYWIESDGTTVTRSFRYSESEGDVVGMTVDYGGASHRTPEEYEFERVTTAGRSEIRKIDTLTGEAVQTEVQSFEDDVLSIAVEAPPGSDNLTVYTFEPYPGPHTERIQIDDTFATSTVTYTDICEFVWRDGAVQREVRTNVVSGRVVTFDYEYDAEGYLVGWSEERSDGDVREFARTTLDVDDHGNWSTMTFETPEGFRISRRRVITYLE